MGRAVALLIGDVDGQGLDGLFAGDEHCHHGTADSSMPSETALPQLRKT